jgi:hypothetical protein
MYGSIFWLLIAAGVLAAFTVWQVWKEMQND